MMNTSTGWPLDESVRVKADRLDGRFALWAGPLGADVNASLEAMARDGLVEGLYAERPSTWSADAAVQAAIATRLGWLTAPDTMVARLPRVKAFADGIRQAGFTDVALLGMGGSSLAPEVLRAVVGVKPGWPAFHMLDSTDPASIRAVEQAIHLDTTLFLLASKSGRTIEPRWLAAHFRGRLERLGHARWADRFVAITDEGTVLHRRAVDDGYRDVFVNPSDIGGRYSALSLFGIVPAALMGHDIDAFVDWGRAMLWMCGPGRPMGTNPAALLGAAMALGARAGMDKLTLSTVTRLESFGLWVEQLVAESTGKMGHGVVPVVGEPLADPAQYGRDRVFVHLGCSDGTDADTLDRARALAAEGSPFAQIELPAPEAIGAEFVRWELATAVTGALLGVNPFDEPNVQQAKDATRRLLDVFARAGRLDRPASALAVAGRYAWLSAKAAAAGLAAPDRFLSLLRPGDYLAVLAYLGPDPSLMVPFSRLRDTVRRACRNATTVGYGPRYLHSTGQLHKGGPDKGVFLVVTADPVDDLPVPGESFSFGILEMAQALGDAASLDAAGRRVLHVHLPLPDPSILDTVIAALEKPLARR